MIYRELSDELMVPGGEMVNTPRGYPPISQPASNASVSDINVGRLSSRVHSTKNIQLGANCWKNGACKL